MSVNFPPVTPGLLRREWDRYMKDRYDPEVARNVLRAATTIVMDATRGKLCAISNECYRVLYRQLELDVPSMRAIPRTFLLDFGSVKPSLVAAVLYSSALFFSSPEVRSLFAGAVLAFGLIAMQNYRNSFELDFPSVAALGNRVDGRAHDARSRTEEHIRLSLEKQFERAQAHLEDETGSALYTADRPIPHLLHEQIRKWQDTPLYGMSTFLGSDAFYIEQVTIETPKEDLCISIFGLVQGTSSLEVQQFFYTHFVEVLRTKLKEHDYEMWNALKCTFVDLKIKELATATIALFIRDALWVANLGDAKVFLTSPTNTVALTDEIACGTYEQPTAFTRSIIKRGGVISPDGLLGGILPTARALGEKNIPGLSSRPKIIRYDLSNLEPKTDLVIASKGVFANGACSVKQVAAKVEAFKDEPLSEIATQLVGAPYDTGFYGSASAIIVRLPDLTG